MNQEVIEEIKTYDKPKISIIMQVYLGFYPNARKNPRAKFKRAVESFQAQLYKNCELVIVADGCNKTKLTYQKHFQDDPNIKFVYIDNKENARMYDNKEINNKPNTYYRGMPRKIGVAMATGELITYMDADDYILPQHTLSIMMHYNLGKDNDWWINRTWFDHAKSKWEDSPSMYSTIGAEEHELPQFPKQKWNKIKLKENRITLSPWLFTHRASCTTKWRDTIGISEDVDFNKRLRDEYKKGMPYSTATYVRCHHIHKWDV